MTPTKTPTRVPTFKPSPAPTPSPTTSPTISRCFRRLLHRCAPTGSQCQTCITAFARPLLLALGQICPPKYDKHKAQNSTGCCSERELTQFCDEAGYVAGTYVSSASGRKAEEEITHKLAIDEKQIIAEQEALQYYGDADAADGARAKNLTGAAALALARQRAQQLYTKQFLRKTRVKPNRCTSFLDSKCGWTNNHGSKPKLWPFHRVSHQSLIKHDDSQVWLV